ncbi:MAG: AtpZ/AtpI family protein [Pseudophaeobacter sp. bin_em_oilr2.035]|uniref:AtpZ/AtpI family protein n=1 Tax=Phaeobacter gallaeciensis TaxID=60890 RepID=A0ABD4X605_9RHOB|nr:AtpZ/AtpI family protein [Phaeobacter gallaeciensis]MDF1771208.1 AtpZ/AtpI family protein [Pseudophaeobacter sp. bin_em_oilr2.035]MDE4143862.1 AtpZ/AtpI family protein [Phaeobacter gallaeciensis]MDE4155776.1 AtpZ/AtpI family protein [Phaeobacter gallaeciensis]MDE4159964.1 AtpZ/AtpI family protein [Phaeobacter gallaeciensis]MDE4164942.1 AtpZ/AtpI family protein [Phaeobacter gallaeciensis]
MSDPDNNERDEMLKVIRTTQDRRQKWQEEGERPLWKNFSMIGALGWLIVAPTLLGVFLGRWLDSKLGTGVTFSGALTFAGACFGFFLAWHRMNEK